MNESLKIECDWWGPSNDQTDITQACRGAIGIRIGDHYLTRLEDTWGKTVRNRMNTCAWTLGKWFAGNWWRLRWEPETARSFDDVDWRMSHSMASAGDGFSWPSIVFASDGEALAVASRPTRGNIMGPVRYLTEITTHITAQDFEREIDAFMVLVLTRLHSEGFQNSELAELWAEVIRERGDTKLTEWRRLEAICGYDPGEAPAAMIELVAEDTYRLGRHAVEEVAAHSRHETIEALKAIYELAQIKSKPGPLGGFRCTPLTLTNRPRFSKGMKPWEKAMKLARAARAEWGFGDDMISNAHLATVFKTRERNFSTHTVNNAPPMPLALHKVNQGNLDVYIGKKLGTSRRFTACRLLGQWLEKAGDTEHLIPAADAKTSQQQFQRAFAQEFLCPFNALMARLQTENPTADAIDDASAHFGVSPLAVRTILVNKGQMDREALMWAN